MAQNQWLIRGPDSPWLLASAEVRTVYARFYASLAEELQVLI
jgi:hypothetical protein